MTVKELEAAFERHDDEFLKFERIANPRHRRADMCAFLMLDETVPAKKNYAGGYGDMVSGAVHDEIWLETDVEELAAVATDDLIRDLARCGVRFDAKVPALAMYV